MKYFYLFLYTFLAKHLPSSSLPIIGDLCNDFRYICCKRFFRRCGKNVTIEKGASFGNGFKFEIGDNSGIGRFAKCPSNLIIGRDVMMAPDVIFFDANHNISDTNIPMRSQGLITKGRTIIEDDVWIGRGVFIMPGLKISKGSVVAAGTVLTKNFPKYSVIGGNPSKILKSRLKK